MTDQADTDDHHAATRDGGPPSRRDVLRRGAGIAPGVAVLATTGVAFEFGTGASEAAPRVVVRREIHDMQLSHPQRFRKLCAAIGEMKRRSAKDPRDPAGWLANADIHKQFCSVPAANRRQVHFSWWFLPWHRAYLSVTERKIQEIAGDPTIGLPYWNYSVHRFIPSAYLDRDTPLFDKRRFGPKRPLSDAEVGFDYKKWKRGGYGVAALSARTFTGNPDVTSFGGPRHPNKTRTYFGGTLESIPHNPVHNYVGGEKGTGKKAQTGDMSDFDTAARDPVFFGHHGNIDRLWEIWRSKRRNRVTEPRVSRFLDHTFPFTWLDGLPIEVSVRETLATRGLGYRYDTLDVFGGRPAAQTSEAESVAAQAGATVLLTTTVAVPRAGRADSLILRIEDVRLPSRPVSLTVYLGRRGERGVPVGGFSSVLSGSEPLKTASLIDVTDAVGALPRGTDQATVTIVAESLSEDPLPPPQVTFGSIRIVARRR